jgi:hypothetical protein
MLIRNGHCGNATLQCFPTTIRVVCANTMAMARTERKKGGRFGTTKGGYAIRHTRNMRSAVAEVQAAYDKVIADFVQQKELYEMLAGRPVSVEEKARFFRWFALNGRDEKKLQRIEEDKRAGLALDRGDKTVLTRFTATVDKLEELFEKPTNQQPGTRNTLYSLLQTAYEYVDHERNTRCGEGEDCAAKRFESANFGSGMDLKIRSLDTILDMAAV